MGNNQVAEEGICKIFGKDPKEKSKTSDKLLESYKIRQEGDAYYAYRCL